MNRKLIYRLVQRELRDLFKRRERTPRRTREPQNIWGGNYFEELDNFIEEDNLRLQEFRRNGNPDYDCEEHPSKITHKRDKTLLYSLLDEMELHVSLVKQVVFIHKNYGMFEIGFNDFNVYFIPSHCLGCNLSCPNRKRHICIVPNDSGKPGWANIELTHNDLLLLSKIIALQHDLLPNHVKSQINRAFTCNPPGSNAPSTILGLRDEMLAELRRLQGIMRGEDDTLIPNPRPYQLDPPRARPPYNRRAAIMLELRELFRRHRQ